MRQFFKDVDEAKINYTAKTKLKPTHILISHKKLEELFNSSSVMGRYHFFQHCITGEMKVFDLIVIPVDVNLLGGDADKFSLLADETSERVEMDRLWSM